VLLRQKGFYLKIVLFGRQDYVDRNFDTRNQNITEAAGTSSDTKSATIEDANYEYETCTVSLKKIMRDDLFATFENSGALVNSTSTSQILLRS
jgi:hypothetical protein